MDVLARFSRVWCPTCNKTQPMIFDVMKANDKNDHDVADIVCDECKSIIATLHGPSAHRAGVRTDGAEKARAMAGQEIDRLIDPSATEEERQRRKRRLLKGPKEFRDVRSNRPKFNSSREAMSPSRKFDSAIRAAVGRLAPGMTRDGYDRAMYYIGIWRALKSNNGRLYKSLEADAEVGGQEWQARIDSLVEKIGRDLVPMARLIGRKPKMAGARDQCMMFPILRAPTANHATSLSVCV